MKIRLFPPQAIHALGQRENQEDALYPAPGVAAAGCRVFLLCDGMGGHARGEVASRTVAATLGSYLEAHLAPEAPLTDDLLLAGLDAAYAALDRSDDGDPQTMGTTLCLVVFHRGGVTVAHIGDSRIYHVRPRLPAMLYQSRDHSLVYELYEAGELTYAEMVASPQKNILVRAVQPGPENRAKPDVVHIADVLPGDYFYLCSDGMLESMTNEELLALLAAPDGDEEKRSRLEAATAGNQDNHSAWLLHVADVFPEAGDASLPDDEQTSPANALNLHPAKRQDEAVAPRSAVEAKHSAVREDELPPAEPQAKRSPWRRRFVVLLLLAVGLVVGLLLWWKYSSSVSPADADDRPGRRASAPDSSQRLLYRMRAVSPDTGAYEADTTHNIPQP